MKTIHNILVPTDFSEGSVAAMNYAVMLAKHFQGRIEVLHAWTAPTYVPPYVAVQLNAGSPIEPLEAIVEKETKVLMEAFLKKVDIPEGIEVTTQIASGIEDRVICEAAKPMDLIVMGTHGRSGLSHLLLGSVAEKVIRNAPCPVLTMRGKKKDA